MRPRLMWLHALSPVHVGAGDSVDVVDLPVIREKVTGWPYLPRTTVKGALRDECDGGSLFREAFGPDTAHADEGAGRLRFADAHLLCFPVRSLAGTFAAVTCPLALRRLRRDCENAGLSLGAGFSVPTEPALTEILLDGAAGALRVDGTVCLEDLDLTATEDGVLGPLATAVARVVFPDDPDWQGFFTDRFAVVADDLFTFLTRTCTDVSAHVKIDDAKKTVQRGGLWYEEAVPAEAIFTLPLTAARSWTPAEGDVEALLAPATQAPVQLGGNASVGQGLVRLRLTDGVPAGGGQ